jgi:5-methylcytosine-specific restriction endonuclease McrA
MPNRPQRMCSKCHGTAVAGTRFCLSHQNAVAVADRQRKVANPVPYNPNCKAWRQTRAETLYRYPQCAQLDEQGNRCPRIATEAHHVIKATVYMAQGGSYLDQDNLVGLCRGCHTHHTIAERKGTTVPGSFAPPDNARSLV